MRYKYTDNKKQHLHELDMEDGLGYRPLIGTTTCINEVYPPPLAWWGSAMALEPFGFKTEKKEPDENKRRELLEKGLENLVTILDSDEQLDKYAEFLESCYRNHDEYKKTKGKEGTDMHSKIEEYIKTCLTDRGGISFLPEKTSDPLYSFKTWANLNVSKFLWSEAHTFSAKLHVGGITDFGFIHKNGKTIVGDAKPSIYHKHFIQTAGYGLQMASHGLYTPLGEQILPETKVDGYCIFDYNKGVAKYLAGDWVAKLESDFVHTVEMYGRKDLTGTNTLE